VEHLGDEETGLPIVGKMGFLKRGEKSAGAIHRYTGMGGGTVNC
jgi:hypothetical protein